MALGEHWTNWRYERNLLVAKVGTGVGCGIVAEGSIYRGTEGAAGDIGHIHVAEAHDSATSSRSPARSSTGAPRPWRPSG
jgi:predicted NBD/HSP70 family sugar kinase